MMSNDRNEVKFIRMHRISFFEQQSPRESKQQQQQQQILERTIKQKHH